MIEIKINIIFALLIASQVVKTSNYQYIKIIKIVL